MITVREAEAEDLEDVAALHRASILELCSGRYTPHQLRGWTDALKLEGYETLLATRVFLVAEDAGALLGFGVLDLNGRFVNATYVSPRHCRRGVGAALVRAMEDMAHGKGATELSLYSTLNAVAFYERLGFEREGPATNRLASGLELACVSMRKRLRQPA